MTQDEDQPSPPLSQPPLQSPDTQTNPPPLSPPAPATSPPIGFDPSRMIGIIKRKALIKKLASMYHAECLSYRQELLELQKKWDEPFIDTTPPEDLRKETMQPPKRRKKTR